MGHQELIDQKVERVRVGLKRDTRGHGTLALHRQQPEGYSIKIKDTLHVLRQGAIPDGQCCSVVLQRANLFSDIKEQETHDRRSVGHRNGAGRACRRRQCRCAVGAVAEGRELIGAVSAMHRAITALLLRDTLARSAAAKVPGRIALAVPFVRLIGTVGVAIAHKLGRNARALVAHGQRRRADDSATQLVKPVETVCKAVAEPRRADTLARALADQLARRAGRTGRRCACVGR